MSNEEDLQNTVRRLLFDADGNLLSERLQATAELLPPQNGYPSIISTVDQARALNDTLTQADTVGDAISDCMREIDNSFTRTQTSYSCVAEMKAAIKAGHVIRLETVSVSQLGFDPGLEDMEIVHAGRRANTTIAPLFNTEHGINVLPPLIAVQYADGSLVVRDGVARTLAARNHDPSSAVRVYVIPFVEPKYSQDGAPDNSVVEAALPDVETRDIFELLGRDLMKGVISFAEAQAQDWQQLAKNGGYLQLHTIEWAAKYFRIMHELTSVEYTMLLRHDSREPISLGQETLTVVYDALVSEQERLARLLGKRLDQKGLLDPLRGDLAYTGGMRGYFSKPIPNTEDALDQYTRIDHALSELDQVIRAVSAGSNAVFSW